MTASETGEGERAPSGTVLPELQDVAGLIGGARVDDVPVLFAPNDGPVSGGLVFRVGWADEPLARRGVTHLVEHLALFGQNLSDVHRNGSTEEWATHFHATGSRDKVVEFLNGVCAALRSLPLDRVGVEKGILATEAARQGPHVAERLRIERYGARGPGVAAYEGFGLSALTAEEVAAWAAGRFTSGNAVAWITGDALPDGLDLRLPEGPRRPIPALDEALTSTPAFFVGAAGVVIVDAVVPATAASAVFASVASRALFRALRQDGGMSYDARCDWERLDPERARLTVFADALPEKQAEVMGEVVDVLAGLRAGRIDQSDLTAARGTMDDLRGSAFLGAHLLPSTAFKLAVGIEIRSPDRSRGDFAAVTADDVAKVAGRLWAGALAQIPEGTLDWAGFTACPMWSEHSVTGRTYPRIGHDHGTLVVGDDGVTMQESGGAVTVTFAGAEALEMWPDGARRMIGGDGFQIPIEPTLHADLTPEVLSDIDDGVPADRHIVRPARAPQDIPAPPPAGASPPASSPPPTTPPATTESKPVGRGWMFYAGIAFGIVAVGLAGLLIVDVFHLVVPDRDGSTAEPGTVLGGLVVTAVPALAAAVLLLADSRRRAKRAARSG